MVWRRKILSWISRYSLPEISGTVFAVAGSMAIFNLTGNEYLAAYGGAIAENAGFYSLILLREWRHDKHAAKVRNCPYTSRDFLRTVRNLLIEFGPMELLDTSLVRPLGMGLGAHYISHRELGVLVGKLLSDVVFYVPVIATYETRKWLERRNRDKT